MAVVSHLIENQLSCLLIIMIIINNRVLHEQADAEEADVSRLLLVLIVCGSII